MFFNLFFYTHCQKHRSKDFQKSEKGRKADQCQSAFNHSTFSLYPQNSKNRTQVLHSLLSIVETHLASQPDLLKQNHGPYRVIDFYATPPTPHLNFSGNGRGAQL